MGETEKTPTSRRDALKMTGVAVAGFGAALATIGATSTEALAATSSHAITIKQKNLMLALSRLVNDPKFRSSVQANPANFTKAYPKLDMAQLALLLDVGDTSGFAVSGYPRWPTHCCCCCFF
jgi:hypothetical protein